MTWVYFQLDPSFQNMQSFDNPESNFPDLQLYEPDYGQSNDLWASWDGLHQGMRGGMPEDQDGGYGLHLGPEVGGTDSGPYLEGDTGGGIGAGWILHFDGP